MTSIAKRLCAAFAASLALSLTLIGAANAATSTNYQPAPW
jgi:hypothetical protein